MRIRIKDLRLRTIIGIYDWEREHRQDVVINAELTFDGTAAAASDAIEDTVNYKAITKAMIAHVEGASCQLLERLASELLAIALEDPRVHSAWVEVDKPHALRFADSVSVRVEGGQV
jgi:D-erythro-7,8-dihydroneopterin triphosphate epimerase